MTNLTIDTARRDLLEPAGLDIPDLERVLHQLTGRGVDLADVYFEYSRGESWSLEDSLVKEGSHVIEQGVGLRAVCGEKTGFAYADDLTLAALEGAAGAARMIAGQGQSQAVRLVSATPLPVRYAMADPLEAVPAAAKLALLRDLDQRLRAADPRVKQVMAGLVGRYTRVIVAASDGTLAADLRPLVRLNVSVIVEQNGRRETASYGGGGRYGFDTLLRDGQAHGIADEALRQALVCLEARPAPAGEMTVVLGPGWPGILLHEAIGHGLEGDFNRKGTSAFAGRVGSRVASTGCTVVDDATLPDRRGSLAVDDEGTAGQCTTLIENGILKGYLQDKQNAKLMGVTPTGNGRRQSYAHRPMPRMTNTYMLPGQHDPAEILASVKNGLYAVNFGGGQVDITNGKFVFSASEAYLIEDGKITAPVKGATLIGNGPDVLTRVSMVGSDLKLDNGVGTCGKAGQSVPVGVGQPTVRIDGLTVGGTRA
ncbi:MAG: metalloprotease TldD [Gammaproteobacteria bacterium]|nr:metalloprotease TldD [Gammaproteobacteria bacterium]MBI5617928.1 metalloprotease TldD [Gammaproteobacteria bacterium]